MSLLKWHIVVDPRLYAGRARQSPCTALVEESPESSVHRTVISIYAAIARPGALGAQAYGQIAGNDPSQEPCSPSPRPLIGSLLLTEMIRQSK